MNRQTFLFILLLIIFLDLPRGGVDQELEKNLRVLDQYRATLKAGQNELLNSEYFLGYGNLTGLQLSYNDNVIGRNILEWPFREYSPELPWQETEEYSIIPNSVSDKVRGFWGSQPVANDGPAYMLNILSEIYGEFEIPLSLSQLEPIGMVLPPYLKDYYNSYRQARYEEDKQRYEEDPEHNLPPQELPESPDKAGNVTTYTLGQWRLNIQPLGAVYPELDPRRLGLKVHNDTTLVHVNVEISDPLKRDRNEFSMFAVYFQNTGALVGVTRSAKFFGTHALPHFAMGKNDFKRAKILVSHLLALSNIDKDVTLDDVTASVERAETQCELVAYVQMHKTAYTRAELQYIDDELTLRQGLPLPADIPLVDVAHALLYSPDCGVVFEKKQLVPFTGIRTEIKLSQLRRVLVGVFLLTLIELYLFMRQAEASRSPSDLSNVSTICIALLSGYDLIVAVLMMLIMWISDLYLICACNTVLNILLFYVFELRYLATIQGSQSNESGVSWWQIFRGSRSNSGPRDLEAQAPPNAVPVVDTPVAEGNTVPTTPGTPTVPAVPATPAPTATVTGPSSGNIMSYFAFSIVISFAVTMLILNATQWSVNAVRVFEYWLLLILNSYWLPQFLRNTLKNRSKPILWEFIFGTSFVRLAPLAYLCLDSSNPFRHPRNPVLLFTVFCWISAQILLLYLQSKLGARFWLNSKWLPEQYNYHPLINVKDLVTGFSRDILSNLKVVPEQEIAMYESDCAICMSELKFPVMMTENGNKKPYEALMKEVMVTPCYHSFHTECLEDWMIYKLQCPVCRTALPPI